MTNPHPLTDKENDKYLQLGWDWAIDEVEMCLDYYFTERHRHRKTYQRDELVRMYRYLIKAMRPTQEDL